jgi:hypothetical protein
LQHTIRPDSENSPPGSGGFCLGRLGWEYAKIASVLLLILLLPVAYLTSTIEELFSPEQLSAMGIRLPVHTDSENSPVGEGAL